MDNIFYKGVLKFALVLVILMTISGVTPSASSVNSRVIYNKQAPNEPIEDADGVLHYDIRERKSPQRAAFSSRSNPLDRPPSRPPPPPPSRSPPPPPSRPPPPPPSRPAHMPPSPNYGRNYWPSGGGRSGNCIPAPRARDTSRDDYWAKYKNPSIKLHDDYREPPAPYVNNHYYNPMVQSSTYTYASSYSDDDESDR